MTDNNTNTLAQEQFDDKYISSSEICKLLGISRATLVQARRRGILPEPIVVNTSQLHLWERAQVQAHLESWKFMLKARRGELRS